MAVTIKEITLWRREIDNQPGALAGVLEQLARAGMDVTVLMAYRYPGNESRGAVEVYPIVGKKATAAAQTAVLAPSNISALLVQGDNRSGLGYTTTQAIADGGINLAFLVAQVIGKKYSAVFGFDSDDDRRKAVGLIKKARPAKTWPGARRSAETMTASWWRSGHG